MIKQILQLSEQERRDLLKAIRDSLPEIALILPSNLSTYHLKSPNRWDHEVKCMAAFEDCNDKVTLKGVKKALSKVSIASLPIAGYDAKPLIELKIGNIFSKQQGQWRYPKTLGQQAAFHLMLRPVKVVNEGNDAIEWKPKPQLKLETKSCASFTDHHINAEGALPYLDMGEFPDSLTEEMEQTLKSKLTRRHLIGTQKHYNYEQIQLELFITFKVWYRPTENELMHKQLILQS